MNLGKHSRPGNMLPTTIEENVSVLERRLDNMKKKITTDELVVGRFGGGSDISILNGIFTGTFSATDYNTVAWTAGDLNLSNGVTYAISAGDTGNMAARTYIYFDLATPTIFTTSTTATVVISDGKTIIASATPNPEITKKAGYQLYIDALGVRFFVDNSFLVQASVDVAELVNGAVTAVKTNLAGINSTTGYIVVSDATAADIVTNGINGYASTLIAPGKILISGATTLAHWSSGTDATFIDGGKIYTGTVTLTQLSFTPLVSTGTSTQIVATINASGEGIVISGAKIELSGDTTITGTAFVNGSVLVNGSVSGAKIDSATTVTAGAGTDVAVLDGAHATYRIYAGHTDPTNVACTFKVSKTGVVTATAGTVGGWTMSAGLLTGGDVTLNSSGSIWAGTGNNIAAMSSADATYRIWVGHATAASAPFRVNYQGVMVASEAIITGTVNATAGYFGNTSNMVAIEAAGLNVGNTGSMRGGQTAFDTGTGFWMGYDTAAYKFSIGAAAGNKMTWNGTTLAITGTVTATAGAIGGWTVGATTLTSTSVTLDSGNNKITVAGTYAKFEVDLDSGFGRLRIYDADNGNGNLFYVTATSDATNHNAEIGVITRAISDGATVSYAILNSANTGVYFGRGANQGTILFNSNNDFEISAAGGDVDFDACNVCVDAGKKVMLEGVAGDTYMVFNSGSAQIEFYVNNTLAGHVNLATGFVND